MGYRTKLHFKIIRYIYIASLKAVCNCLVLLLHFLLKWISFLLGINFIPNSDTLLETFLSKYFHLRFLSALVKFIMYISICAWIVVNSSGSLL